MTDRPTINVVQCALFAEAQAAPARQPSRKKLRGASRHQESAWTPTSRGPRPRVHAPQRSARGSRSADACAPRGRGPPPGPRRKTWTMHNHVRPRPLLSAQECAATSPTSTVPPRRRGEAPGRGRATRPPGPRAHDVPRATSHTSLTGGRRRRRPPADAAKGITE